MLKSTLNIETGTSRLSCAQKLCFALTSFAIVAFGQPAWSGFLGLLASAFGYALFWRIVLEYSSAKTRFLLSLGWYSAVQMIQLSWMVSHPYFYIYSVYLFLSFFVGLQFGLLSVFVTPSRIVQPLKLISLAALWTLLEWSRLFLFSGYTWNPAGIALTGSLYSMQIASVWGVFGLSFWAIFSNLLALRAWLKFPSFASAGAWSGAILMPYAFGAMHFHYHDKQLAAQQKDRKSSEIHALLVQTAFPAEEAMEFKDTQSYIAYVFDEWRQIVKLVKPYFKQKVDLIALPEYVVPLGTYTFVYPADHVKDIFASAFGESSVGSLPALAPPFAQRFDTPNGKTWFVNNAYWAQGLANVFQAEVIAGLEDVEEDQSGQRTYYSAAIYFHPMSRTAERIPDRYAKRVLLPMAEYIPFSFCRALAARYGISGSFSKGESAKVWTEGKVPFGVSICYEETFGNLMRENRQNGAELLVNLTNDGWYPDSWLPHSHLDHARLRTVESGIPLLRACNTGITCGLDSLGRVVSSLQEAGPGNSNPSGSLLVKTPAYHYQTLYTKAGDWLIVGFSMVAVVFLFIKRRS